MKGQAAMEYLMTYGWAILVVIAVIAALYMMGVFRIGAGAGPCTPCFPSGSAVAYIDHNANVLVLRVGPRDLQWINVTAGATEVPQTGPFYSGNNVNFTSAGTFSGDIQITVEFAYTDTPTIVHSLTATLHGG